MNQYDNVMLALQSGDYWVDLHAGEVWSKKKHAPMHSKNGDWRRIGTGQTQQGYKVVRLPYPGGVVYTTVHRVVWMVAFGPIPDHLEVDHKDSDHQNNSIDNLQLLVRLENIQRKPYGSTRKLTPAYVIEMRQIYANGGITLRKLAAQFGVSHSAAHNVVAGISWPNIQSRQLSEH